MQRISPQAEARLSSGVQKFQPILRRAQLAGRNESDTVMIITDILCEVFGYDKYENITSELCIKQQFCDLAVQLKGKVRLLLECKAVGVALRDVHVSQATAMLPAPGLIGWCSPTVSPGEYTRFFSGSRWRRCLSVSSTSAS